MKEWAKGRKPVTNHTKSHFLFTKELGINQTSILIVTGNIFMNILNSILIL